MRCRGLLLFTGGMLAGAVLLYVALWSGGVLTPYLENLRAESRAATPRHDQPATGDSDRVAAPQPPPAPVLPPEPPPEPLPGRAQPKIGLPIEGLEIGDVRDMFNEGRAGGRAHEAIDIMAERGTPVRAMVSGNIEKLFTSKPGGLTIYQFDQAREFCYYYAHLDRYADGIAAGREVARGTVIGYVGSTGNANPAAPHLHLAIFLLGPDKRWWEGTAINPYPILMGVLR